MALEQEVERTEAEVAELEAEKAQLETFVAQQRQAIADRDAAIEELTANQADPATVARLVEANNRLDAANAAITGLLAPPPPVG